jgi:hypothetical protein
VWAACMHAYDSQVAMCMLACSAEFDPIKRVSDTPEAACAVFVLLLTGAPLAVVGCHSRLSAHAVWWHAWRRSATQTYWMQVRRRFTAILCCTLS